MYNLTRTASGSFAVPAFIAAAVLFSGSAGAKPPAEDLDCQKCVESAELEPGAVGLRELAHDAVFVTTLLVRADGTPGENCTALLDALVDTSIATETDPYLIKLEPGIYDCPFPANVAMNPYVDIEGSGQTTTIIRGHSAPVVRVAANSELRQVTVEALGVSLARGIDMRGTNSRLANVTVIADAEEPDAIPLGVSIGPNNARLREPIEVDLDHVTVRAGLGGKPDPLFVSTGIALKVSGPSRVRMTDVVGRSVNTGVAVVAANSALMHATGSVFEGSNMSLRVEGSNTAEIVASQLVGPLGPGAGTAHCIASFDGNINVLLPNCTP